MNKSANPSIRGMCLNLSWKECFGFTRILCVRLCVCGCMGLWALSACVSESVCSAWMDELTLRLACSMSAQEFSALHSSFSMKTEFDLVHSCRLMPPSYHRLYAYLIQSWKMASVQETSVQKIMHTFCLLQPCYSSGHICFYHERLFVHLPTACVCASHVWSEKARQFPPEKCRQRNINLLTPGGTSRKTETLKAGRRAAWGRNANINRGIQGERVLGPVGCLKPGQEVCVCVCVCAWACLAFLLRVFVWMCWCICMCVDAPWGFQCVCVGSSENAFPDSPLLGWKRAINSRVSPGSGPATEALARKWLISVERKGGGGDKRIFVSLIISQPRQTTLAG